MDAPGASIATTCPSCRVPMAALRLARRPHGEASIDVCAGCRALWFDGFESAQLTPGATLALLEAIHDAEREPSRTLAARLACPRCSGTLALTRDLTHTARIAYHRCERGHGRFTPFVQFLLEKSFVRPLPPAEVERLRQAVGTVRCNGCGAAIDLATDTACRYCRAPIAVLDPDALGRTVAELTTAEARRHHIDTAALVEGLDAAGRFNATLVDGPASGRADAILAAIELGATALDILFTSRR
ncbi:MAG: zf-TFIIB domain-containing protein [Betaproteobacteria bacterium]